MISNGVITIVIVVLITACIMIYILWKNSRRMDDTINLTAQQQHLVRHDNRARALCRAVRILNPHVKAGIDYVIKQDNPEQEAYIAEWMSDEPQPAEEAIKSALLEISDVRHEDNYAAMRRAEYPSVGDQLDAAYQARQGDNTKQLEIDAEILRVKEHYPKGGPCM